MKVKELLGVWRCRDTEMINIYAIGIDRGIIDLLHDFYDEVTYVRIKKYLDYDVTNFYIDEMSLEINGQETKVLTLNIKVELYHEKATI